jgi:hypothetical protein
MGLAVCAVWMVQACAASAQHTPDEGGDGGGGTSSSGSSSGGSSSGGSSSGSSSGGASSSGSSSGGATDGGTSEAATGTADSGGDSASTQGCGTAALCDDFESDTVGSPPSSSLWTLVGTAGCSGSGNPSAPIKYPIVVDSSQNQTKGGTKSVKVTGGDSCGPLMINTSAFSQLAGGEVYGRFYIHLSDTVATFDHTALMALGLLTDGGVGLNIGDQASYLQLASEGAGNTTNVLMWQTTDGNILPNKNTAGGAASTYPAAAGFTCVEFHTSVSGKAIETWVNSNPVTGLTSPPMPASATQWVAPSPFTITSLGLGWIVFSGPTPTVWYDDVALSRTRIFCQ